MPEPDGEPRATRVQRRATRTRRRELGSDPTKAAVRLLPPAAPTCWRLSVKARPGPNGTEVRSDPARRRPLRARSAARGWFRVAPRRFLGLCPREPGEGRASFTA